MIHLPLMFGLAAAGGGYTALQAFRRTTRLEARRMPNGISTYRGGLYCGPGWGFVREDVTSGRIAQLPEAIDAIDRACRRHDQCYDDHGYFTMGCNLRLAADLVAVVRSPDSTVQQRLDATIMAAIFEVEALTVDVVVAVGRWATRRALLRADFEIRFRDQRRLNQLIEQETLRLRDAK